MVNARLTLPAPTRALVEAQTMRTVNYRHVRGVEEERMRYRQRQFLKALLLCFLTSLVVAFWIYVLRHTPP
jgi:hypothetical protein